tara:strand:+ start:204 stop:329 length:126 start_codon:yes stop_codon:yes gene_type:complete
MIQSNNSPHSILTGAILTLALGVALEAQAAFAAPQAAEKKS